MQIFVKSLDSTFAVTVSENADVRELKAAIEDVEFVPAGTLWELYVPLIVCLNCFVHRSSKIHSHSILQKKLILTIPPHAPTPPITGLQRLVIGTTQLDEGTLYPMVKEADTVTLLMGIDGGMRAKWRKKRMRRLRRKRRKMRQRAR